MREVRVLPSRDLGRDFVPAEFMPAGVDEHYLRNLQGIDSQRDWRPLRSHEIQALVKNAVTCTDWDSVFVCDPFTPHLIKNCEFSGLVRIGKLEDVVLEHHDLRTPAGITDSLIIACDIGDNVAIHGVRYLSHFIVGDNVILINLGEMHTTNHAKFGNGILKDGETEDVRITLDLMNETGARSVLPFDGMIAADAYLWARYRDDTVLQERLKQITQEQFDSRRGFFGIVGDACVIKNSQILKDVKIGPCCYIKGANKLKNLTINSSEEEPTQIGEGVELVNGIVGLGCHIFYGCKAVRFVMGNNSSLKYGARLVHSFLGANSTVSCCELLNNLIFPAHEQHHNNSFLVAALLLGQSNIAAGATIGSNHNSRANDGEIFAGRGFWPGLCTTLKHPSRFASFTIVAQGNYTSELNVPLPFALLSKDSSNQQLMIMPAYWWMYNMYALARNSWKYTSRDLRLTKTQHIEFAALAPDTVEEIFQALTLLELWTAQAQVREGDQASNLETPDLVELGRTLLSGEEMPALKVLATGLENSRRPVEILKPRNAYAAYRDMVLYYAVENLVRHFTDNAEATLDSINQQWSGPRQRTWVNLGGQLVPEPDLRQLREQIRTGELNSWGEIHGELDRLWVEYPLAKQRHAYTALCALLETSVVTEAHWQSSLQNALRIQEYIRDQVYATRRKDFDNPFRQATFENSAEMEAVLGTVDSNAFVAQVAEDTVKFQQAVASLKTRGLGVD